MTVARHRHRLAGCAPAPLAHYLKALGILRLVAEQKDASARGAWLDEAFIITTTIDADALRAFLRDEYRPTPLIAPWNGGSGFYPKDQKIGIDAIAASTGDRWIAFRAAIAAARLMTAHRSASPKDDEKSALLSRARKVWRGGHREWLDAAIVLGDADKPAYPALFGTGGNDGRLDFTNNNMQRLAELHGLLGKKSVPTATVQTWLDDSLFATGAASLLTNRAIGQYLPGGSGGFNSTTGPDGDSHLNPWDFVLMLEGAVLFTAHASRRFGTLAAVQASAPFAVRGHAAGFGSASAGEEGDRGEQWMPLWERFASVGEVRRLLSEGRARIGARQAERPLDLARAVARLGVARGLTGFVRYAYLERNGQNKLAVPVSRIVVRSQPRVRVIDDLETWLNRLHREARSTHAPARLVTAERRLADALFAAATHSEDPQRWQGVLLALAGIESIQAHGAGFAAGPIPALSPEWVESIDDGTAEVRLALSLALAGADTRSLGSGLARDSLRHHWLPLDRTGRRFHGDDKRLAHDVRVVATGRDPLADLIAIVDRRLIEAESGASRRLPIMADPHAAADSADIAAFILGHVDSERCVTMARALMALDIRKWTTTAIRVSPVTQDRRWQRPDDAWCCIRIALLPGAIGKHWRIPADPAIVRRLAAGDAMGATAIALRRLQASGLRPALREACADADTARIWAAALAFPISPETTLQLAKHLDSHTLME